MVSKKAATTMVAIASLKINLFVRQALNSDRILDFAQLLENGVVLPPIKITEDYVVIDGRHRIEAHDFLSHAEIEAEVALIAMAYKANVGGALPPSTSDTEHTVMLLLQHGVAKARIGEILGLPKGLARRYVGEIQSKSARAQMQRAVAAVTDGGLTVAKAAEQYDVEPEKLKETMSGRRRKTKNGVEQIQRGLTSTYRSLGLRNTALFKGLLEKCEDGDVTPQQVRAIAAHLKDLQRRHARLLADWERRFEVTEAGKSVKKTGKKASA